MIRTIRRYVSDGQVLTMLQRTHTSRTSYQNLNVNHLIRAIRTKNYDVAASITKNGVSVDSHNENENTPLADAAKRGDLQDITFLVETLCANPNVSCHCPLHRTPLHYAAEGNHLDAVKLLLKLGANPNLLDSRKKKPIDVAKSTDIIQILEKPETNNFVRRLNK